MYEMPHLSTEITCKTSRRGETNLCPEEVTTGPAESDYKNFHARRADRRNSFAHGAEVQFSGTSDAARHAHIAPLTHGVS